METGNCCGSVKMNDQLLNIQFVQEVEKHPCLYNYTLPEYSRRDVTEKAWSEVGKKVNLTGSQSKEKWRNLRAVFTRHMKPGPSGSSTKKKKTYYLLDAMQFTIPFIKSLSLVSGNVADVHHEEIMIDEEDHEEFDSNRLRCSPSDHHLRNQPHSPMSSPRPPPTPPIGTPHSVTQSLPTPPPQYAKKNKNNSKVQDDCAKSIMDYLIAKKATLNNKTDATIDTRKMFLLSLLDDVNSMTDAQMRTFKRKVLAVIDEILEEPTQQPTQTLPSY